MSWKDNVRRVQPYVPGDQPKVEGTIIKLNTNECPYPPTPTVVDAMRALETDKLRLYPDTTAQPLTAALAKYYDVSEDEIFVGVGSDDVLAICFQTFFNSDKPVLFPDITYSFYDVWADLYRVCYERPALDENFRIKKEDYYRENGGIILANPNAPTGIAEPVEFIEDIVKHNPDSIVIVDEAYVDFGAASAIKLTEKYDNLLIVQTFSKSRSFAGMRIGFAIGNKTLIKYMNDVKFSINSYTMNLTSICYGIKAVEDEKYFRAVLDKVIKTREDSKKEFVKLGFNCTDSKTNFLFVSHEKVAAKEIYEYLKKKNIFVRHFAKPRIDNWLRISIGTDAEMHILFKELRNMLAEYHA